MHVVILLFLLILLILILYFIEHFSLTLQLYLIFLYTSFLNHHILFVLYMLFCMKNLIYL